MINQFNRWIVLLCLLVLSTGLFAQSPPWQRINPLPFECTIADAQVLDNGRIVGVGDASTIVYSDNFGSDWTIMYKAANAPYLPRFTSLCFIDNNNGWAAGSRKTIVRTYDGGNTWTLLQQNSNHPSQDYTDIEFINDMEGFVIYDSFNDTLLKTHDGGVSWEVVTNLEEYSFTNIDFVNQEIGFIYGGGGYILKTMDVGNNWEKIEVADTIENLWVKTMYFLDEQTGFIGASVNSTYDNNHYVLKTEDGGNTWEITTRESDYNVNSFGFSNADTGYTVGYVPWYRNNIMRTIDGGDNWELITDTIGYWFLNSFCTGNDGKVLLFGRLGQVFNSYDFGSNWEKSFANPIIGFDALSTLILNDSSILLSSEGGTGGLPWFKNIISHDRGITWTDTEDYYGIVFDIHFINDTVGFYCGGYGYSGGNNYVYKTTNGGLDWDYIELADNDAMLNRIEFVDDSTGFIGGMSEGFGYYSYFLLYKTTDQGESWEEVNIGYYAEGEVVEFDFYNDSSAIITGYIHPPNGQIIRTNDRGNTWYIDSLPFDSYFTHVHFMNSDTGILFGLFKICKTIDGGESWSQVDFEYNEHIYPWLTYEFTDGGIGYLYLESNSSMMFKTEDYGDSWEEIEIPSTVTINSMSFFNPDEGIVAGESSIIFKTHTGGLVRLPEWGYDKYGEEQLLIYPNPTQSKFSVIIPEGYENGNLKIYDLQGRLITDYTYLNAGEMSAEVNIQNGIYIVMIENSFSRLSGKLIIMD